MSVTNTNQETGYAYGVLNANRAMYLFDEILEHGTNLILEDAVEEMLATMKERYLMKDPDALVEYGQELGMTQYETQLMVELREENIQEVLGSEFKNMEDFEDHAADIFTDLVEEQYRDLATEAAYRCLNLEECPYAYERPLKGQESYKADQSPPPKRRTEKYQLFYLGGAPLIMVLDSPYAISCRQCSPCVPYAGDLDNLDEYGNTIAHCPPMSEWGEPRPKYRLGRESENGVYRYRPVLSDD